MEEDRGSENYGKVVIFLNCGCTKLMRAVVNEQIDTSSAHVKPEERVDAFLYDKRAILFPRGRGTHAQKRSFENTLYPGYGRSTDIDQWDLQLLAFVALRTCDQSSPTLMMDFEELKKIRNALCHSSDGVLSNDEYNVYMVKIRIIFKRTVKTLKNAETISDLKVLFDTLEFNANQMVYNESLSRLRSWYQYDKSLIESKLDRLDEGQENIVRKIDQSLDLLNKIYTHQRVGGKGIADGAMKMPETEVVVAVKNCKPEQEKTISNLLVSLLDSKLRNDAVLKTELSEDCFQRVASAVQEAVSELSLNGHPLSGVQHGCVVLRIRSSSYTKLKALWYMAMDGTLTRCFRPVEMALKLSYPDVKLEVYIPESEWWKGTTELAETLEGYCRLIAATNDDVMSVTETSGEDTPGSCIKSATVEKETLTDIPGMTRVSLKIAPTSEDHLLHIAEVCQNGKLDERLKDVANALKDAYNTKNIEIKVLQANEKENIKDEKADFMTAEAEIPDIMTVNRPGMKRIAAFMAAKDEIPDKRKVIRSRMSDPAMPDITEDIFRSFLYERKDIDIDGIHHGRMQSGRSNIGARLMTIGDDIAASNERRDIRAIADQYHGELGYQGFRTVVAELFRDGATWGRITVLVFFTVDVVIASLKKTEERSVAMCRQIIEGSVNFGAHWINSRVQMKGGWDVVWGNFRRNSRGLTVAAVGAGVCGGLFMALARH